MTLKNDHTLTVIAVLAKHYNDLIHVSLHQQQDKWGQDYEAISTSHFTALYDAMDV